jgi:hypothetical protein
MGYVVRADVMDVQVPERSLQQRMRALQQANEVRQTRAEWKRAVKRDTAVVLLPLEMAESEGWSPFDTMHVGDYLGSIPKVGPVKVATCAAAHGDQPGEDVGGPDGAAARGGARVRGAVHAAWEHRPMKPRICPACGEMLGPVCSARARSLTATTRRTSCASRASRRWLRVREDGPPDMG